MTPTNESNPYASPKTDESARRTPRQQPVGWLRQVVMGVPCAVAAPVLFFLTAVGFNAATGMPTPPINVEFYIVMAVVYGAALGLLTISTLVLRWLGALRPLMVASGGAVIAAVVVLAISLPSYTSLEAFLADPEQILIVPLVTFAFSGPWLAFGLWLRLIERRRAFRMSTANPYESPTANNESLDPPAARPPFWPALLGLLLIPIVTGVAGPALWPVYSVVAVVIEALTSPVGGGSGIWLDTKLLESLLAAAMFGAINALIALPFMLLAWRYRGLRPRRVVLFGVLLSVVWWTGLMATLVVINLADLGNDVYTDAGILLYQPSIWAVALGFGAFAAFVGPLPLVCGFLAYARWIRRLLRKAAGAAGGEA